MAAGVLPTPGKRIRQGRKVIEIGPCVGSCQHIDCAQTRAMAESRCRMCGVKIGFEVRFYQDPERPEGAKPTAWVHADCLEEATL